MSPSDPAGWFTWAAILGMACAAHLIRFAGYWTMGRVPLTPRLRRMLDALPGSVVAATVVPIVFKSGPAAALGIAVVLAAMALRRNEFLAVFAGMAAVALARAMGF
jgi:uncharacterized membrane protein